MENESLEKMNKILKKTRVWAAFSSIASIGLIVAIIVLILSLQQFLAPVYSFLDNAKPALEKLSQVDMNTLDKLAQDVSDLSNVMKDVDLNELQEDLNKINKTIERFETMEGTLGSIFGR